MPSETPVRPHEDEALDGYIGAVSALLGLEIDPDWRGSVLANFKILSQAAQLVESQALPDDLSAAPVFEA